MLVNLCIVTVDKVFDNKVHAKLLTYLLYGFFWCFYSFRHVHFLLQCIVDELGFFSQSSLHTVTPLTFVVLISDLKSFDCPQCESFPMRIMYTHCLIEDALMRSVGIPMIMIIKSDTLLSRSVWKEIFFQQWETQPGKRGSIFMRL